jgi:hypothetical protein
MGTVQENIFLKKIKRFCQDDAALQSIREATEVDASKLFGESLEICIESEARF